MVYLFAHNNIIVSFMSSTTEIDTSFYPPEVTVIKLLDADFSETMIGSGVISVKAGKDGKSDVIKFVERPASGAWSFNGKTWESAELVEDRWAAIKSTRAKLLASSDWTQVGDSPLSDTKKEEWKAWRASLRDITAIIDIDAAETEFKKLSDSAPTKG